MILSSSPSSSQSLFFCSDDCRQYAPWTSAYIVAGDNICSATIHDMPQNGFEPRQKRRENFLLQGRLSVLTLISVSVPHPCYRSSTRVKTHGHSAKSEGDRLQLNIHAPYVALIRCMAVLCTQKTRRNGSSFTWHQPCNNQIARFEYPLRWIYNQNTL